MDPERRRTSADCWFPRERFPRLRKFYREHGKGVKVIVPAVLAVVLVWFALESLTRVRIVVPADNTFLIEAERERKDGGAVLLRGKLVNRGEDVPDLSLRSIGVIAEFLYSDGRTERKRVFPKSPFRGEGALFRGETGAFEIEVPKGVKSVTLRGEIVNLGEGRVFVRRTGESGASLRKETGDPPAGPGAGGPRVRPRPLPQLEDVLPRCPRPVRGGRNENGAASVLHRAAASRSTSAVPHRDPRNSRPSGEETPTR